MLRANLPQSIPSVSYGLHRPQAGPQRRHGPWLLPHASPSHDDGFDAASNPLRSATKAAAMPCRRVIMQQPCNSIHAPTQSAPLHGSVLQQPQPPYQARRLRRRGALHPLRVASGTSAPPHDDDPSSYQQDTATPTSSAPPTQASAPASTSSPPSQQQQRQQQQQRHWFDAVPETQRYVLADEWGFTLVGTSLPSGVPIRGLLSALPESVFGTDMLRALAGLVAPLAVMAAGYAWLWYMHSITPWWQMLACWLAIGTSYVGLFQAAHECARGSFLPDHPRTEAFLGALLMAPSLFGLDAWRARVFSHGFSLNELGSDTAWQPVTVAEVASAGPLRRTALRLATSTPLKLLASIGGWVKTLQSWDLFSYYDELRRGVLISWVAPAAFVGLVLPAIVAFAGGLGGLVTYWLGPWFVFHLWLSTLTLLHHTAPHIPWRTPSSSDHASSVISGTVTVPLPGWLETLLNYPNYNLPQHLMFDAVPFYHAKAATQALREKLWPYMQEAPLSVKLLTNHITKWQVYDEASEQYITFDRALELIQAEEGAVAGGQQQRARRWKQGKAPPHQPWRDMARIMQPSLHETGTMVKHVTAGWCKFMAGRHYGTGLQGPLAACG